MGASSNVWFKTIIVSVVQLQSGERGGIFLYRK
jgi:hypothetical protein